MPAWLKHNLPRSTLANDTAILQALGTDGRLEIALRHIGSHFYMQRIHDRTGALQMRAITSPGNGKDVVPSWMVNEATTFSKSEHQRAERATAAQLGRLIRL